MKDLKEALGNNRKPDITHVRSTIKNYIARACEYGSDKYERANYLRKTSGPKQDFERLRSYLRATISHLQCVLDAMELHQANDPNLYDTAGMERACYCPDTDATPGAIVGASGLPHLAHGAASLNMALEQAANSNLLPRDPGTPWKNDDKEKQNEPVKEIVSSPVEPVYQTPASTPDGVAAYRVAGENYSRYRQPYFETCDCAECKTIATV